MIVWLLLNKFPEDTEPEIIWYLFMFEILVEVAILVLVITFIRLFVL